MKKKIAILGTTGSIGKTLINIIKEDKKNFEIGVNKFLKNKINIKKYLNFKKSFLGPKVRSYKDFSDICVDYLK